MSCLKKSFETNKEAKARANEINIINRSNKDKTKLRPYKCECGKFHLTSMSKNKYLVVNDQDYRVKTREKNFIRRETEYWEKKLNIK